MTILLEKIQACPFNTNVVVHPSGAITFDCTEMATFRCHVVLIDGHVIDHTTDDDGDTWTRTEYASLDDYYAFLDGDSIPAATEINAPAPKEI
jgi:hypothetical protein